MPNICSGNMLVKGRISAVDEFIKILESDYSYTTKNLPYKHFFRVFDSYVYDTVQFGICKTVSIGFDCAWSATVCMLNTTKHSYYAQIKKEYPDIFMGTTIEIESARLKLDIEIWTLEEGMCFQEHIRVCNGVIVLNDCIDYVSYYKYDDYTYDEFIEEAPKAKEVISREQFDNANVDDLLWSNEKCDFNMKMDDPLFPPIEMCYIKERN